MLIAISSPQYQESEIERIQLLFGQGLETLHLRKPDLEKKPFESLLKTIPSEHKKKVVLHQHHELAGKYNVKGLHLREENRQALGVEKVKQLKKELKSRNLTLSSSFHSFEEIEKYDGLFDYVFLGPVFESISKPGYASSSELRVQSLEQRKTKIIALGGIQESNIATVKDLGFDGVAILGAIWQEPSQAISRFETIRRLYESSFKTSSIL